MSIYAWIVGLAFGLIFGVGTYEYLSTGSGTWGFPWWFEVGAGLLVGVIVLLVVWGIDEIVQAIWF